MTDNEKRLEEERLSAMATLRASYEMYERSKVNMLDVRKGKKDANGNRIYTDKSAEDTLELMETMQKDIVQKYIELGGSENDLKEMKVTKKASRAALLKAVDAAAKKDGKIEGMKAYMEKMSNQFQAKEVSQEEQMPTTVNETKYKVSSKLLEDDYPTEIKPSEEKIENRQIIMDNIQTGIQNPVSAAPAQNASSYDTVKLPSRGECYPNKIKEVEVSYLNAYDENLILSPNLYRNGTFLDHILKNKVRNVNPETLVQGDRDAIIIWLRASGYGNEYPIHLTDEKTGKEFDSVADLSKINYKKFKLKGDAEGHFEFTMPRTKDIVKFRYLTSLDLKKLQEMKTDEEKEIKITNLKQCARQMRSCIENNNLISGAQYDKIEEAINTLEEEILAEFKNLPETYYSHDLTNSLILSTVSVNGNTDRKFIIDYILNLNAMDAISYKKYMAENEPGVDYNIKVKRPDSLGGGYVDTFLQLDQFILVPEL